ncbi:adenylate cyclase type 9-like isoform X2 [Clavelina lepadiformis]|uniref:adenylate cyclase type 9-like isoform X2 n=1 Tax=Clavelina lepadiformis TaxID=159417 RepID=UPI0040412D64
MSETSVAYNVNSRSSNVNFICHENGKNLNPNDEKEQNKLKLSRGKQPVFFERASPKWWDISMNSRVLEEQYKISSLPQVRSMLVESLAFICISCIAWIIYFSIIQFQGQVQGQASPIWSASAIWSGILAVLCIVLLILAAQKKIFKSYSAHLAIIFLGLLIATGLASTYHTNLTISTVGSFFIAAEVIILIYLILPFPIAVNFCVAIMFSIVFEVLHFGLSTNGSGTILPSITKSIIAHVILHLLLHALGCQLMVNLHVLRHSTFWKICQVVRTTQVRNEKEECKAVMIKSVMPVSVAKTILLKNPNTDINGKGSNKVFRPYTMERKENVSILYADIVGFTQMSANKTAAELVGLLNDLFGRFDGLCQLNGCEKISTLGDCYYCVAGCPESKPDHAKCCVEMGLGMVAAIKDFCREHNINVNMRVGIHTGYVLCGIVGTKRYRFDVWSNDVTIANGMEQHGIPGRIHISQATLDCLNDQYVVEDSKLEERDKNFMEKTGKTYLIVEKKHKPNEENPKANEKVDANGSPTTQCENNVKLNIPTEASNEGNTGRKWLKRLSSRKHEQRAIQKPAPNLVDSQEALARMLNQEDRSQEWFGEHTVRIFQPGNLTRIKQEEDKEFVKSIKEDSNMGKMYKNKTVNRWSLMFLGRDSEKVERDYRNLCEENTKSDEPIADFISPRYRLFLDLVLSSLYTLLIFISSILLLAPDIWNSVAWIVMFVIFFLVVFTLALLSGLYTCHKVDLSPPMQSFANFCSTWKMRHIMGGVLLLVPTLLVLSHLSCRLQTDAPLCSNYFVLFCLVILHFLNFNQLMSWMRSLLAIVASIIFVPVMYAPVCPDLSSNATYPCLFTDVANFGGRQQYEFILDVALLLCFVWYINRQTELGYRLDFYAEHKVELTRQQMEREQTQVDALIENFIPPHVSKVLKDQRVYSKTHYKVGVIFGTIVNFNELYEEDFEGGFEFIRYLSELISDVDELLNQPQYKDIEKIKTIGTTFMLASGLNPKTDQESTGPESHLCKLMDFCIAMQDAVDTFNKSMLNFHLILRIGFNHGEVTAGVIGSTKRLYDIWGDTVNTASRMDSTGVPGRIQVSENSKKVLEDHFEFMSCGTKFIKGKGMMETFLLVRPDEDQRVIKPNPRPDDYPQFNLPPTN